MQTFLMTQYSAALSSFLIIKWNQQDRVVIKNTDEVNKRILSNNLKKLSYSHNFHVTFSWQRQKPLTRPPPFSNILWKS